METLTGYLVLYVLNHVHAYAVHANPLEKGGITDLAKHAYDVMSGAGSR